MPDVKSRIAATGGETTGGTTAAFAAYIKSESAKWRRVVKDAKLTTD